MCVKCVTTILNNMFLKARVAQGIFKRVAIAEVLHVKNLVIDGSGRMPLTPPLNM